MLAPESARFEAVVARFAGHAHRAGFGLYIGPMFEDAAVFRRGVGEESEVVAKEMYEFEDKGGRVLALRPEGTASAVRAFIQHRPPVPWKAWYVTPAFRYEAPQAGRYRQHHQLGVEALGTEDPDVDVEVIALLSSFLGSVGVSRVELRVNSMGDADCMPAYREALAAYLAAHDSELCDEHRERWRRNPLRVLDCKRDECVAVRAGAPRITDYLCELCRLHFARVLEGLDALGIASAAGRLAGPGPRLLHAHHLRVQQRSRSTRPRTASAAAGATTGWWRCSAVRRPRASASGAGSSASSSPARPKGPSPTSSSGSTSSSSISSAARRHATSPMSCARRESPPTARSTAVR